MQKDRIITWNNGAKKRPSATTLTKSVRTFFGKHNPRIETDADRLYIAASAAHWIELELTPGEVNVITRKAPPGIESTAELLAETLAKLHKGEYKATTDVSDIPFDDDDDESELDVWDEDDEDLD